MKIDADEITLDDLLSRSNIVYQVPVYQRPYSWGEDQWMALWDDVMAQPEKEPHFIGSLVVIKQGVVVKRFDEMEVVDGQQRLTTLSILLCAIRDFYVAKGEDEAARRHEDACLYSTTRKSRDRKLFLGRKDDSYYEGLLKGRPAPKHLITLAYEYFKKRIEEHDDPDHVADKFTSGVSLVLITAENAEDAFKLFETLNDRGLELSAVDLIKNNILSVTARRAGDELDGIIEFWDNIMDNLEEIDKIRFFRQYMLATRPGKVSNQRLYTCYKARIDDADIVDWVLELHDASEVYKRLHSFTCGNPRLNRKLEDLTNLMAVPAFTLLLKLFLEAWNESDILGVIPAIEAFSFRRMMCNWSTGEMDTIFNQWANQKDGLTVSAIVSALKSRSPDDEEFRTRIQGRDFRQNTQTKYMLEQFEYHAAGTHEKRITEGQNVHIEHIMPQTISSQKCRKVHGGDWEAYLGEDAGAHGDYVSKLGNLTLLAAELNVPASNNPFEAKKRFYEKSEILITKALCGLPDFRIEQIKQRSEEMAGQAVEIWNF